MVKKGQAKGGKPGGGGGVKKPTPASTTGEDSFIVFTNSDKEPKARRPAGSNDAAGKAGPVGLDGPALAGEAPKRPDVKKLIGGASWTGKLPVNMLSEHCQKQKWDKPDYSMVGRHSTSQLIDFLTNLIRLRPPKDTHPWSLSVRKTQRHKSLSHSHRSNSLQHINTSL